MEPLHKEIPLHGLLQRQLNRYFPEGAPESQALDQLLQVISQSYNDFEKKHLSMERAMELSCDEVVQANSKYVALINAFPDMYIVLQSDGTVSDFRMGTGTVLHFIPQIFPGQRIQDIDFGGGKNHFAGALDRFKSGTEIVTLEQPVGTPDGMLHFEARIINLTSAEMLVVMRDRTEQKKAEEQLLLEKERLLVTLRSLGEGVIACSSRGRIMLINPAALAMFHVRETEASSMRLWDLVAPLDIPDWKEQILDLDPGFLPEQIVVENIEGERRIIAFKASLINLTAYEDRGMVIVLNDITDEVRQKSQIELSQKMEGIGQLAAGIAHEINTPLQYIGDNLFFLKQSYAELIAYRDFISNTILCREDGQADSSGAADVLNKYEAENDIPFLVEEIPNAINQSLQGIQYLKKLILALKDFSHPGNSTKQLEDMNQILETVLTISRNEWKHFTELRMNLDPQLPQVRCIRDEINQVFLNIVINAAQAIREQEARHQLANLPFQGLINVDSYVKDGMICVRIRDNGPGIPVNLLNRVFDPFFTTKDVGKGTGQGLAIAYDIVVNKHGGLIEIESEPEQGTAFIVSLPISQRHSIPQTGGNQQTFEEGDRIG